MSSLQQGPPTAQSSTANVTPQLQQGSNFESPLTNEGPTASQQQAQQQQMSEMTESERWGLPGLMAQLRNNTFFQGQELTALDMDLDKSVHRHSLLR